MTLFVMRPVPPWREWFDSLAAAGRAAEICGPDGVLWCATERSVVLAPLFPDWAAGASPVPGLKPMEPEAVAAEMLRGHLDVSGPCTAADLAQATALGVSEVSLALVRLETEGFALRGRFSDPDGAEEWCARRVLTRIHAYSRQRKRREVEPVTARDFMRFLLRWQHVTPDTRREGSRGVLAVVEQLQGFELAAGAWEKAILPARVTGYRKEWLDEVCLDGGVAWGRLSVRDSEPSQELPSRGLTPSRATPITLMIRDDLAWLLAAARGSSCPASPGPGRTRDVLDALAARGALFQTDLTVATGRLPGEIEDALWDGVARGLLTADGFRAVRSLFAQRSLAQTALGRHRLRRGGQLASRTAGRWSLLPAPMEDCDPDELAEAVAEQLAVRLGRGVPGPAGPGEHRGALAGGAVGVPADGGARHDQRRTVRQRVQRRAVRAPGRGGRAARDQEAAAGRRDGRFVRGRPAEPGRRRAARPADPGRGDQLGQLHRRGGDVGRYGARPDRLSTCPS